MDKEINGVHATAVTLFGIATGLYFDTLLAGFCGGLVSLSFLPPMGPVRRLWSLVVSTLFAGYLAQAGAWWFETVNPWDTTPEKLPVVTAFLLGLGAQLLIPIVLARMTAKASAQEQ